MSVKRVHILIVIVLGLVIATAVFLVLTTRSRNQRIERYRAYAEIKLGDSRDTVIGGLGKPDEVTGCPYTPFADPKEETEFRSKCFQQYRYVLLMREYKISFDRNGAVIGKSASVSP